MANGTSDMFLNSTVTNGSSYGKGDRYTAAPNEWVGFLFLFLDFFVICHDILGQKQSVN